MQSSLFPIWQDSSYGVNAFRRVLFLLTICQQTVGNFGYQQCCSIPRKSSEELGIAPLSLHRLSKWLKFPQNHLPTRTDRPHCPPSWMKLCTVRVTWRTCSTSETALLFCPLRFAGFRNNSPLLVESEHARHSKVCNLLSGHYYVTLGKVSQIRLWRTGAQRKCWTLVFCLWWKCRG